MRKMSILAILTAVCLMGHDARAAERRAHTQVSANQGQGPVNRLMELERRKNVALMFFGR